MFFKKVEIIYVQLHSLRKRFNKIETEMNSEKEIQLKKELEKLHSCCAERTHDLTCLTSHKTYEENDFFQKIFLIQNLGCFFTF